jgi:prolyl-tRNA synthetase
MEKGITKREKDFSKWYQDVIKEADLAEHAEVRGSMIIKPYGYAIWENFQKILDKKIKETGAQNVYFPLFIPESYFQKEKEHVEGFSPELAVVTHAGGKKLEEPLVVRPTSETIINKSFSRWINSWRDLPIMINQWVNVVRWELRPRLFLRTTEFLWQEGHTAHTSEEKAEEEAIKILEKVYKDFAENYMAVPVIVGRKSESEKFAGALRTYTIEALMQDGKALQMGTSHNLGQNFARVFDITYVDEKNKDQYVWQSSWGVSTRLVGGLIMAHSDDKGLILPPKVAPIHAVIIPIWKGDDKKEETIKKAEEIKELLDDKKIEIDDRPNETVGSKFFEWEKKGVPVRIEIGEDEINSGEAVLVRRDTGDKKKVKFGEINNRFPEVLDEIQKNLFGKAKKFQEDHTYKVESYEDFKKYIEKGGFVYADWCGEESCEVEIKEETKATIRCVPFGESASTGTCVKCGKKAKYKAIFAKGY